MQVRHLSAYDVAPSLVEAFQAAIGDTLLPAQELAVREGLLAGTPEQQGQNMLVAAPTSAGKTFIGEMAAVHAAERGQRVLYLVPLKSMAEEAYRNLGRRYQGLGLEAVISTRDHREADEDIGSGRFRVAVLVFEKLMSLLVSRPEILSQVGLVVLDELHLLTDAERGPRLELLLTKIRRAQRSAGGPQLLCLSAPIAGLEDLAGWLGAHLVLDERRPVELRSGVLHRGRFLYRSSQAPTAAGSDGEVQALEEQLYPEPDDKEGRDLYRQLELAVRTLCARGEQTLVFLPDRARCLEAAQRLCTALSDVEHAAPAGWALDEIGGTDEGLARQALLSTLRRGVAFHNSDLTQAQREIVERAFGRGEVRVLCSTSTLAMGVNLPARNVILTERWKWRYSRRYNKWVRDEMTKVEYDGMAGRAGRLGLCDPHSSYGRAMLIAPSRFDAEVWLRTLIDAPVQELHPPLLGRPLGDVLLDLFAADLCRSEAEAVEFLLSTFTGWSRWAGQPGAALGGAVGLTLAELCKHDLLVREEDQGLRATAVGRACARMGLQVRSAVLLTRWADAAAPAEVRFTPLEVLLVCALTPDGGEAHVPLSLPEHRFGDYWTRILLKAQEFGAADRRVFRWLRDQRGRMTYEQTKAVKKALLLLDWVDNHDSGEIERDHGVWSGSVAQAAQDFAWLVQAQRELCEARGWPAQRTRELTVLAERLRYGVPEGLLPLARATTRVLSRSHLRRVADAGMSTEEGLLGADPATLERTVGHRGILQKIYQIQAARAALQRQGAGGDLGLAPRTEGGAQIAQRPLPMIRPVLVHRSADAAQLSMALPADGGGLAAGGTAARSLAMVLSTEVGVRRCYVLCGDRRVALSPVSFALLTKLALAVQGWVRRERLGRSPGGVRKGISRLRHELRALDAEARSWVENDGHGRYRLSLLAPTVVADKEALSRHPLATVRAALRAA